MAKATKQPETRKLIRVKRHTRRWRRGVTLRISDEQIERDGLKPDDYEVLTPAPAPGNDGNKTSK